MQKDIKHVCFNLKTINFRQVKLIYESKIYNFNGNFNNIINYRFYLII
jgi:hypothetical protein